MLSKPMRTSLTANPDESNAGHGTEQQIYSNTFQSGPSSLVNVSPKNRKLQQTVISNNNLQQTV